MEYSSLPIIVYTRYKHTQENIFSVGRILDIIFVYNVYDHIESINRYRWLVYSNGEVIHASIYHRGTGLYINTVNHQNIFK